MKKVFLILLFCVLCETLFGQIYYIAFDYGNNLEKNADGFNFILKWSDNTTTTYKNREELINMSGYYPNYIKSITMFDPYFPQIKFKEKPLNLGLNGIRFELGDIREAPDVMWCIHNYNRLIESPYLDSELQDGNYYCATKDLYFRSMLDNRFYLSISYVFSQWTKRFEYENSIISYNELSKKIDLTQPFYLTCIIESKQSGIISSTGRIAPIYPYVEIDESKLAIVDDKFYYPELHGSQKITFKNIKTALNNNINANSTEPYNLENYYGLYNVIIEENKRCPIIKSFIYPELKYNYVNNSEEYNFWYEGEEGNPVNLSLYSFINQTDLTNLDKEQISIVPNMDLVSDTIGFILCQNNINADKTDTVEVKEHIYTLSTTDTLSQIKITSSNKDFIPVTRTVSLKSYPQILEPQIVTEDATCYYDTTVVKVSDIEGGLDNGYKFMLEKDDKQIWTDKNPIKIPATIFGGNEQEVKLYVYDKEDISEDTGREKRAFSTNINFNYGETLDIKNWQVADLKCFEDNTGKISISDWTPKNEDIKFEVWKSENKISDSQITENLAAGDYNLKIVDGNDCVNDSFQVTVNQPDKLQTSVKSFETPLCYGYADGKISTTTIGGTGDYTFLWNNGATTSDIENLNAGIYQLTVTDENECQTSVSQVLTEPEELKNSLQSSYTICKNGELKIDEGELKTKEDLTYWWHFPNGNIHEDRVLVVTSDMPDGDYIMYTSDSKGCFTKDTTNIKFADNELNIKFLAPTYSYLGDTVVLAEDSEIFTDYTWSYQFNNDMFEDITSNMCDTPKNQTFLKTWAYGTDTITMYANDGHCNASFSKEVNILNEQRLDYSNYEAPSAGIFTRLAIGPNPNDGNFTLYANLTEEAALDVFILDLQTALKIPLKYNSKFVSDHYAIPVHGLNLLKGVYALFVTANGDTKYIKFTIK